MRFSIFSFLIICIVQVSQAQNFYFPPLNGIGWEKTTPEELGWCTDKIVPLYNFLEQKESKAFIVLKDGKIVLEKYFDSFTQDSLWYWASAGKTLTGMLVGIAQQEGLLDINEKSSKYLQEGWTSLPKEKEDFITIKNQLTMTSGLNDSVDPDCTLDTCLIYEADAGTRWAYHNAPYTLLDKVIEAASGKTYNSYFSQSIKNKIGMNGTWLKIDYNNVYFSNARSMARYGILLQNRGIWNGNAVLNDTAYFNQMTNSSQNINQSYGYLTWLNGKASFMLPQSQIVFGGKLMKDAPDDLYAAMGKNGQIINVVPSKGIIVVRMGNPPNGSSPFVPNVFNNDIWQYLNEVICGSTSTEDQPREGLSVSLMRNPVQDKLILNPAISGHFEVEIISLSGKTLNFNKDNNIIDVSNLPSGTYFLKIKSGDRLKVLKWIKI